MILNKNDGIIASTPDVAENAKAAGYIKCNNPSCDFWISPEAQHAVERAGGYYTCPNYKCKQTSNLIHELPWMRSGYENYDGPYQGGTNNSGLNVSEVGQLGEDVVSHLKELPGYGPITWWHSSGVTDPSPVDGATKDWAIEVKTLLADSKHHRFIPGGNRSNVTGTRFEKEDKNEAAAQMGKQGILGLLVILDMRRSVADIYAKEMPIAGWTNSTGRQINGVAAFRNTNAEHLIAEVPFKNPYMDPSHPAPQNPEMPF